MTWGVLARARVCVCVCQCDFMCLSYKHIHDDFTGHYGY